MEVNPRLENRESANQRAVQLEAGGAGHPHQVVGVAGRAAPVEACNLLGHIFGKVNNGQHRQRSPVTAVDWHVDPRTLGWLKPRWRSDVDLRLERTARVGSELALVDDRVAPATVIDRVGKWTKASAIDLIDEQPDDGGRVVAESGDGEVEVGRERPGGAGIDLAERGAALERHQCEDPTLGQVTQQQILGYVDDRGIAALRRLSRRVAQNVAWVNLTS